jgi:ABC-type Mn2+/Zn2+ transport system ATPase subunit
VSAVLAFEDITFGYGRTPVLDHAGLRVQAGEFVAVIGAKDWKSVV